MKRDLAGRGGTALVRLEDTDILTSVCKNLVVGVVVCDADGGFVFFSPEAERVLGIGDAVGFRGVVCRLRLLQAGHDDALSTQRARRSDESG